MVRGKVQLQRIEDRGRRLVCFSKRKSGLIKKAEELSVLCDAEMAMIIFSATGKLFEFCSAGHSLRKIFQRYESHKIRSGERAICKNVDKTKKHHAGYKDPSYADANPLQLVQRYSEGKNIEQLNMTQLIQLERELNSILIQTRARKEKYLTDETNLREREISAIINNGNLTYQQNHGF